MHTLFLFVISNITDLIRYIRIVVRRFCLKSMQLNEWVKCGAMHVEWRHQNQYDKFGQWDNHRSNKFYFKKYGLFERICFIWIPVRFLFERSKKNIDINIVDFIGTCKFCYRHRHNICFLFELSLFKRTLSNFVGFSS